MLYKVRTMETKNEIKLPKIPEIKIFDKLDTLNKLRLAVISIFVLSTLSMILVFVTDFIISVFLILVSYIIAFVLMIKLLIIKKL